MMLLESPLATIFSSSKPRWCRLKLLVTIDNRALAQYQANMYSNQPGHQLLDQCNPITSADCCRTCSLCVRFPEQKIPFSDLTSVRFLNVFAVRWYGESEFWLALSKVLLSIGLILFTFITMVGGNPIKDRFGFRFWNEPGAFAEYYKEGSLGRWLGFLACLIQASFTIAGPDYISMAAGESINPRGNLPKAYNGMFYRLTTFFILGALCVGILVPYNDKTMSDAFDNGAPGAAASPYVIAMDRLGIPVLPHIVNAMILLAVFSAGNSYVYCASRTLFGLALDGKAPRIFARCTKAGVPVYCVGAVLLIALISFLQVSNSASVVLDWIVSLVRFPIFEHSGFIL